MKLIIQASQKIAERLTWCTASRAQVGIAQDLAEGNDISEVYGLGEAGLFDEFFYFLEELGFMGSFLQLDPGNTQRTSNVKFPAVILIYLMRIVAGLAFFWHIDSVILCSQPLMRLVGFNGRQIREGTSSRGNKSPLPQTGEDCEETEDSSKPSEIRGPYCPDSIASYVQAITAGALERLFNGAVSDLAARSFFPKKIYGVFCGIVTAISIRWNALRQAFLGTLGEVREVNPFVLITRRSLVQI